MNYPIIDCHADTFSKILLNKKRTKQFTSFGITKPDYLKYQEINIERTRKSNLRIQTQSLYIGDSMLDKPLCHALEIIAIMLEHVKEKDDLYIVKTFDEDDWQSKYGILISIEGLEVIENNLDLLDVFYELGVRMIAPTWNRITRWFTPITEKGGMLSKGKELIDKLNSINTLLDISHLSDQSVYDLEKLYQGTIIASHSNIRNINASPRNLTDDEITIIKERNGLIGINFFYDFLHSDAQAMKDKYNRFEFSEQVNYNREYENSDMDLYPIGYLWIVEILEYLDKMNALDCVCFGSDFDGIHKFCPGLENPTGLISLQQFLRKAKISEDIIAKLFYQNALRVFKTVL